MPAGRGNPNIEKRNPKQIRSRKLETEQHAVMVVSVWSSNFEFVSDFEIRISGFTPG